MKILVMSDTHGDSDIIRRVMEEAVEVDAIFHCGDSELLSDHEVLHGIHVVRGNCDVDQQFPEDIVVDVNGVRVFMTHGHLYNIKSTLLPLRYRAEEVGADIVLFGHSHMLGAEMQNNTLFVNPGSLKLPRGRKEKSYAIIEISLDEYHVSFYNEENVLIETTIFIKK